MSVLDLEEKDGIVTQERGVIFVLRVGRGCALRSDA